MTTYYGIAFSRSRVDSKKIEAGVTIGDLRDPNRKRFVGVGNTKRQAHDDLKSKVPSALTPLVMWVKPDSVFFKGRRKL